MMEARRGGFTGNAAVIPLGVDLEVFNPILQQEARRSLPFNSAQLDSIRRAFIVGNVNRNQPRKRLDLTVSIFAEWIKSKNIRDAYLLLHVTASTDLGFDLSQLAAYYEISNRIILIEPEAGMGIPESEMKLIYGACDVMFTTTQGEGWGLPTMEAMACGVPTIAPDWAALGEWAKDAAILVPIAETICTPNGINAIGGLINRSGAIQALDRCYSDRSLLQTHSKLGLALVGDSHYRWENIGSKMADVIDFALSPVRLRA
jgi:glycosyltransferase involved in cell wall biosynthesis